MLTTSESDLFWMEMALSLAEAAAELDEVPVGALIVSGGRLIATGINLRESTQQATAHAELLAIEEASRYWNAWRLPDCTLYVTLEPCLLCAGAIYQARIPRAVYGARDAKGGALGSLYQLNEDQRLNHRYSVLGGVRAKSSADLLSGFFRRKRGR
jgi:tRNA(adenine34) deaminase